jgi:hypothetical protein
MKTILVSLIPFLNLRFLVVNIFVLQNKKGQEIKIDQKILDHPFIAE